MWQVLTDTPEPRLAPEATLASSRWSVDLEALAALAPPPAAPVGPVLALSLRRLCWLLLLLPAYEVAARPTLAGGWEEE